MYKTAKSGSGVANINKCRRWQCTDYASLRKQQSVNSRPIDVFRKVEMARCWRLAKQQKCALFWGAAEKSAVHIFFMTSFIALSFLATLLNAVCPPPITEMPLLVTWYDPARGGINCDADCSTFADNSPVTPEAYGQVTACIPEWLGAQLTISGLGTFHCRDTGDAILIAYNQYYESWVIHVDVLRASPPEWNYQLRDWELNRDPHLQDIPVGGNTSISYHDAVTQCNMPEAVIEPQANSVDDGAFGVVSYETAVIFTSSCTNNSQHQNMLCET